MAPEPEPGGPLDRRHHLIHRLLELRLAPDFPRPLLAGRARGDKRHEAPPGHPAHSSPFPTAVLTTRAMSLPATTMPCRSSSWRSNRSSSARLSARVGGNGRESAGMGGMVSVAAAPRLPPSTASDRPLPPSIFSI